MRDLDVHSWALVFQFIPLKDLSVLKKVSKSFRAAVQFRVGSILEFSNNLAEAVSPLDAFQSFLNRLSLSTPNAFNAHSESFIQTLRLGHVQENLYEPLPLDWLNSVLRGCPSLVVLDLRNVEFLNDTCIKRVSQSVSSYQSTTKAFLKLKTLQLQGHRNLTTKALKAFVSLFPSLRILTTKDCGTVVNDDFFGSLPLSLPLLETLSLVQSVVTYKGFHDAFSSNNAWPHLTELDVSETMAITDDCLISLAYSRSPLSILSFLKCQRVTIDGLIQLSRQKKHIRSLDLTHNTKLECSPSSLLDLFSALGRSLLVLGLSYIPIDKQRQNKPLLLNAFEQLDKLKILSFTNIYETTPHNIIKSIGSSCLPSLKSMRLHREQYTSDDMLGFYAPVTESHLVVNQSFVDEFNGVYGKRVKLEIIFTEARS